jgi:hypothetical protein
MRYGAPVDQGKKLEELLKTLPHGNHVDPAKWQLVYKARSDGRKGEWNFHHPDLDPTRIPPQHVRVGGRLHVRSKIAARQWVQNSPPSTSDNTSEA